MSQNAHEPDSSVPKWQRSATSLVHHTAIFDLMVHDASSRIDPRRKGKFYSIRSRDWVNVIALTAERQVVLIEQYRHGLDQICLEIPGGIVDAGEDPLAAGVRELREETGYEGPAAKIIGWVTPNPALMDNRCATVLVRDAVASAALDLDDHEEIAIKLVDLDAIPELIQTRQIEHALVVAAFYHLSNARVEGGGARGAR